MCPLNHLCRADKKIVIAFSFSKRNIGVCANYSTARVSQCLAPCAPPLPPRGPAPGTSSCTRRASPGRPTSWSASQCRPPFPSPTFARPEFYFILFILI